MRKFIETKTPFLIPILRSILYEFLKVKGRFITTEKIFTDIYDENKWGDEESCSGPGSSLAQTEIIRNKLPELLKEYNILSILDIPCGDFNWMKEVNLDSISYIGADIVEKIILAHNKKYSKENRKFIKIDILKDELPRTDLIFCRDLFIHLSNKDILKAIENIKKSRSKYLLVNSYTMTTKNRDIPTGRGHPINLSIPPFSFPCPLKILDEEQSGEPDKNKKLLLFEINDL